MQSARPVYVRLLMAAIAAYILATALMLADLYRKVGIMEHQMLHVASTAMQPPRRAEPPPRHVSLAVSGSRGEGMIR